MKPTAFRGTVAGLLGLALVVCVWSDATGSSTDELGFGNAVLEWNQIFIDIASLAALSDDGGDGGQSRQRGLYWGIEVANAVLAWRAADGFSASYPAFTGGSSLGQWRPTPPSFGPMSAQCLAFTQMFVRPDGVSCLLGGQRQRPLEPGGKSGGARKPPEPIRQ